MESQGYRIRGFRKTTKEKYARRECQYCIALDNVSTSLVKESNLDDLLAIVDPQKAVVFTLSSSCKLRHFWDLKAQSEIYLYLS